MLHLLEEQKSMAHCVNEFIDSMMVLVMKIFLYHKIVFFNFASCCTSFAHLLRQPWGSAKLTKLINVLLSE